MHFLFGRIELLYPSRKCIAACAAGDNIAVGKNGIILGVVNSAAVGVALAVLDCVANDAFGLIGVIVVGDVKEHTAVVGEHGVRVGICVVPEQHHSVIGLCELQSLRLQHHGLGFEVIAVLDLVLAVNGYHCRAVGKQLHGIRSAACGKTRQLGVAFVLPDILDLIVLAPCLRPVEARGSEYLLIFYQ